MKRSEINQAIEYVMERLEEARFPLPPFAYYTPDDWKKADESEREIVENMLGWDVTDFGEGDFSKIGLTVFTFRNGNFHDKKRYPKPYAEKMLYVRDGQILPYHYHWYKGEDIINRGGGELEITLYNCSPEDFADKKAGLGNTPGCFLDTDVEVTIDGKRLILPAGSKVILKPGQSISVKQGQYHTWQAIPGKGDIILFEVSMTNDDHIDNRFYKPAKRIPDIEEDEQIRHLMFADYKNYYMIKE